MTQRVTAGENAYAAILQAAEVLADQPQFKLEVRQNGLIVSRTVGPEVWAKVVTWTELENSRTNAILRQIENLKAQRSARLAH